MRWGRRGSAAALAGGAPALAIVLAALLLAACTTSRPNASRPGAESGHRPAIAGRSGFKVHSNGPGVAILGGPNSGVIVALPGAGGPAVGVSGGGSRPQIVLPPIPPANSTQSIAMPLDSYEQVASQEQETLTAADDLLT